MNAAIIQEYSFDENYSFDEFLKLKGGELMLNTESLEIGYFKKYYAPGSYPSCCYAVIEWADGNVFVCRDQFILLPRYSLELIESIKVTMAYVLREVTSLSNKLGFDKKIYSYLLKATLNNIIKDLKCQ